MARTVTLRLEQDAYEELRDAAAAERRSLSNFIATAALERVRDAQFVDDGEMVEILNDDVLVRRLRTGSRQAHRRKGRFVALLPDLRDQPVPERTCGRSPRAGHERIADKPRVAVYSRLREGRRRDAPRPSSFDQRKRLCAGDCDRNSNDPPERGAFIDEHRCAWSTMSSSASSMDLRHCSRPRLLALGRVRPDYQRRRESLRAAVNVVEAHRAPAALRSPASARRTWTGRPDCTPPPAQQRPCARRRRRPGRDGIASPGRVIAPAGVPSEHAVPAPACACR